MHLTWESEDVKSVDAGRSSFIAGRKIELGRIALIWGYPGDLTVLSVAEACWLVIQTNVEGCIMS